jgi:hypothetical protein
MIDDLEKYRIEKVCKRLKNSVSPVDVVNWLNNFKKSEVDKALLVLENLEFITENEIIELYEHRLSTIINKLPNHKIIVHPIADYGKSSTLMVYYFKKTPTYKAYEQRFKFYPHYSNFKYKLDRNHPEFSVIFLDDFSGSGNQFNKYYQTYVKPQLSKTLNLKSIFFLTLFYLPRAKSLIEKSNSEINVEGEIRYPVFLTNRSVFGNRDHMLPIREMCHSYGKSLFSIYDKIKQADVPHPLGYNNSQALIVFAYNPPNNTLPIIWSSKNWNPLFPRVSQSKISESKKFRKELAHEIGLLRHSDISGYFNSGEKDLGWKTITFITKTDFIIYSIVNLLKQRRTVPVICQILGITEKDYIDFILKKRDVFADSNHLTEYGENLYIQIKKQLKLVRKELKGRKEKSSIKQSNYLPKNFKGVS